MKVTIDPISGFCFGVNRAIRRAEIELEAGNAVYSLGEMVHNKVQMDQLKASGLIVIEHSDLPGLKGETVLFRAHGEPPATFQLAKELGIKIIDATCPLVTKLQQRINISYLKGQTPDCQIVIYGKPGHAEVAGLTGNAGNKAIILNSEKDINTLDFSKPVRLFSQTTMDGEEYQRIGLLIKNRMDEVGNSDLEIQKSVCQQVSGRAPALRKFAADHNVIIFVSGKNSANGAYLFGVCKSVNEKSFRIESSEDIVPEWFENTESVGVSGATSTPGWLIDKVADAINNLK